MATDDGKWKQLIKDGEVSIIGYLNPDQFVLSDEDQHTMVECFLKKKPFNGDRKAVKVRVIVRVINKAGDKA